MSQGWAHPLYFLTGGRAGDRALSALLQRTIEHRTAREEEAPRAPGDFLVHHYVRMGEEDRAWLLYLVEEALARGAVPIPHEAERVRVTARQVDEIRSRQVERSSSTRTSTRVLVKGSDDVKCGVHRKGSERNNVSKPTWPHMLGSGCLQSTTEAGRAQA